MMIRDLICARPGAAATQCGAGIPAGTTLAFKYVYNSGSATIAAQAADLAAKARQAGIQPNADYVWAWKKNISGPAASFRSLTQYFANPEFWSFTG